MSIHLPAVSAPLPARPLGVAALMLAAHVALIWALERSLLERTVEVVIPAQMLAQVIEPPTPVAAAQPPAPLPPAPPKPAAPPPARPPLRPPTPAPAPLPAPPPAPAVAPTPTPLPAPSPAPAPASPAPSAPLPSAAPASPTAPTAPVAPAVVPSPPAPPRPVPAPPAPASATAVELPSTRADYLQNPKPAYPAMALRLGESGRTVHRVWIGPDGRPQKAELVTSSGYPRLDKASYDAVMSWRYVPGKRGGVPELMAFDVPISWELPN